MQQSAGADITIYLLYQINYESCDWDYKKWSGGSSVGWQCI